jgi:hypothetical protein
MNPDHNLLEQRIEVLESWRSELLTKLEQQESKHAKDIDKIVEKLDSISASILPIRDWMNNTKGWKSGVIFIGIVISGFLGWMITTIFTWRHG